MEVRGVYSGKEYWALVLGGSSGLGWAAVKQLAAKGMNIAMVHRDRRSYVKSWRPEWEELTKQWPVKMVRWNSNALLDEEREEILDEMMDRVGKQGYIRVFVHALSRGNLKKMTGDKPLTSDDISHTAQAMGTSYYEWAASLRARGLFKSGSRCIGFTSAGNQRAWAYYAAISVAKNVLESLSRSMAVEWGPEGIRSNLIQAGITDTPSLRAIPGHNDLLERSAAKNPLGRTTRAEDVAKVVELLCRTEADWINGAVIPVDGGETLL